MVCCPHGPYTILPLFVLITAWVLSVFASQSCLYAYRPAQAPTDFGFFNFYVEDPNVANDIWYCNYYDRNWGQFSLWFNIAKVFSVIAVAIGGVTMLAVIATCCCSCGPVFAYWGTWGMVACAFSQGFTLFLLVSTECSTGCSLNTDGILSIVAVVLWFLGAVVVSQMPVFLTDDAKY